MTKRKAVWRLKECEYILLTPSRGIRVWIHRNDPILLLLTSKSRSNRIGTITVRNNQIWERVR